MSRNEWERGTFKIPAAEWAELKKKVRDADNAAKTDAYALAVALYAHLSALPAAERTKDLNLRALDFFESRSPNRSRGPAADEDIRTMARFLVCTSNYDAEKRMVTHSLSRPKKSDFAPSGNNAVRFVSSTCDIEFDNATRTVHWIVHEGNHSAERARNTHMGKALVEGLRRMTWTRGTGGTIVGNDEHNEDAGRENGSGGGTYTIDRLGPLGKQDLEDTKAGYATMAASGGMRPR